MFILDLPTGVNILSLGLTKIIIVIKEPGLIFDY